MDIVRNRWLRRLAIVAVIAAALAGLDRLWPKPVAVAAYQTGVMLWRADFLPYNKHAATPLFRFARYRHYAPAQMAMYHLLLWSDEISPHIARAMVWFRGAESQGYVPTLYHKSFFMILHDASFEIEVKATLETKRTESANAGRSADALEAETRREVHDRRITYAVLAGLAVAAGDPFAPRVPDEWWTNLSRDERKEVLRRVRAIQSTKYDPLRASYPVCHMIRTTFLPVIHAGIDVSLRCLEWQRQHPASLGQWLSFVRCAEKLFPPGSPDGPFEVAMAILRACPD